ncbi:MAG TPA: sialidase family protein [Gemmatimonadales bacterium]|nr:sialidase family protein [Gemmatimonadales bacterium]
MTRFSCALAALALLLLAGCERRGFEVTSVASPVTGADAGDAALAVAPDSAIAFLAWVAGDTGARHLWFARSADRGATWSAPIRVTGTPDDIGAPHGESAPRLVAGEDGKIGIVWSRSVPVPGRRWPASEIRFARSLDGGATWSAAVTLNDDSTGAPGTHTFHGAIWTGDAGIVAAWLDERGGEAFPGHHHPVGQPAAAPTMESDARIYFTASGDFGATWAPNRAAWGAVCPCCRVALAREPSGGVVAAWRQHFPGSIRDVVTAPLLPEPAEPSRVHRDDWEYPGCPHTGPAMTVDRNGATHIAWYTGKPDGAGMFYGRIAPGDSAAARAVPLVTGRSVQTGHGTITALADGGALTAFDVDEGGGRAIRLAHLDASGELADALTLEASTGGSYPQVAALDDGSVLVAWRQAGGEAPGVRLARVSGM